LDPERRSVCLQEVIVENGTDQLGAAVNTWSPLLIRDIPVYAWWRLEIDPSAALLRSLQELSDKVIVDTESVFDGDGSLERVLALQERFAMAVSDFTWLRLADLRLLSARAFDSEELLARLNNLKSLAISGAPPAYARLYVGWLASRLGWKKKSSELFTGPGGDIAISLGDPSEDYSMEIAFSFRGGDPVSFRSTGGTAAVQGSSVAPAECVFSIPTTGELLLQNIDSAYSEFLYLDALRSWLGKEGPRGVPRP
jgi:glucose-6-phosphate dehydrogenase assembly protein OpcA